MKPIHLLILFFAVLFSGCLATEPTNKGYTLKVIEQDYDLAMSEAEKDGKLLFIDFYTTWCGPCKKIDKLVFQNDSIQEILQEDIVLLRYDAENDTVFHLSKKHHVSSYPTGLILNGSGRVVNRKYGFSGDDFKSLSTSVLEFLNEGVDLNRKGEILEGYSGKIDPTIYPGFYVDYVNRTDTKKDSSEINSYFVSAEDVLSEQYFSTLLYFAREASDEVADMAFGNRDNYSALYGELDSEILMYSLVTGKFGRAIEQENQVKYDEAVAVAKSTLSKEWTDDILPSFEKEYLMGQNKWDEVLEINKVLKENGELSNGYINHFSWQVYKDCSDQEVVKQCLEWMKEVTEEEPDFNYLDTHAYLAYKSGDLEAAKEVAHLAIAAGKQDGRKTSGLEKLIDKLEHEEE